MNNPTLKFLKTLAIFTNVIIGVGIFGLPYIAMKTGLLIVLCYFITIAALSIVVHYLLSEVTCGTAKVARLPGYAEEYLGSRAKKITFVISTLGILGALLAYLVLGGEFLSLFFKPLIGGSPALYLIIYFLLGAFFIYKGTKVIARLELITFILFLGLIIFFFLYGLPAINLNNFTTFNSDFLTLPYGIILFSLWGIVAVPELNEMVGCDKKMLRKVISSGIIIATLFYLIFIITILGVSGPNTSKNAFSGFALTVGSKVVIIGYLFGLITSFDSFIALGLILRKILALDFKVPKLTAWLLTCLVPLILYLLGFKNFIEILGLTGGIILALEAIIVIFIYRSFAKQQLKQKPGWWIYVLILLFIIGIIAEIFYFFHQI